jgi:hypothetical protein
MRERARGMGANLLLGMAVLMLSLMVSSLGVDIGVYLDVQNELQTAANAGALAGAAQLPLGENQAVSAARRLSMQNRVSGNWLSPEQVHITTSPNTVEVVAHTSVTPTMMSGFCQHFGQWFTDTHQQNCLSLPVAAHAKAVPAARDTVLVIDASSSMSSLGNNRPLRDVQAAAKLFADMVANQPTQTSDRIALVTFHQTGTLQQRLTSEQESPNFTVVKQRIDGIRLFSGTGWNTNYHAGLKTALDELAQNGRPNAEKRIVFMTDGMPNLPAPASYYSCTCPAIQ